MLSTSSYAIRLFYLQNAKQSHVQTTQQEILNSFANQWSCWIVRELQQFQSSIMMENELLVMDKKPRQTFLTISFTVINGVQSPSNVFVNTSLPGKLTLVCKSRSLCNPWVVVWSSRVWLQNACTMSSSLFHETAFQWEVCCLGNTMFTMNVVLDEIWILPDIRNNLVDGIPLSSYNKVI